MKTSEGLQQIQSHQIILNQPQFNQGHIQVMKKQQNMKQKINSLQNEEQFLKAQQMHASQPGLIINNSVNHPSQQVINEQYYTNQTNQPQAQYYTYLNSFYNDSDFALNGIQQLIPQNLIAKNYQTKGPNMQSLSSQSIHNQKTLGQISNLKQIDQQYNNTVHEQKGSMNQSQSHKILMNLPKGDSNRLTKTGISNVISSEPGQMQEVRITTKIGKGVQPKRKSISKIISSIDRSDENSQGTASKKLTTYKTQSKGRIVKQSKPNIENILGFYSSEKTPKRGVETLRYDTQNSNDEIGKPIMISPKNVQNNFTQPDLNLHHQQIYSKRVSARKNISQRNNNVQLKLKSLNNQNGTSNFESLENLNTQSNLVQTTKISNQIFSISQNSMLNQQRESFNGNYNIRHPAAADYLFIKDENKQQKLQQKIQKIIKSTSNTLQLSQTQKDLNLYSRQHDNSLFRQQSLKQFHQHHPTSLDEKLIKFTGSDYNSRCEYKPVSHFKGQIIRKPSSKIIYNHKESIEETSNDVIESKQSTQQWNKVQIITDFPEFKIDPQLAMVLQKTKATIISFKKREIMLVEKIKEQADEIQRLQNLLSHQSHDSV